MLFKVNPRCFVTIEDTLSLDIQSSQTLICQLDSVSNCELISHFGVLILGDWQGIKPFLYPVTLGIYTTSVFFTGDSDGG